MTTSPTEKPQDSDSFAELEGFTDVDNVDEFVSFIARDGEELTDVLSRQLGEESNEAGESD